MKFGTWLAIYFIIWWTVLFAMLPLAVRRNAAPDEAVAGTDPGAPARPNFALALGATTAVSLLVLAFVIWLIEVGLA